jgi:hypothetical protein
MNPIGEAIKNKNVSVVGLSKSLIGSKYGSEINSSEIVIRLNKSIPVPKELYDDLGDKTDILCTCLDDNPITGGDINPLLWKKNGVSHILIPFPKNMFLTMPNSRNLNKVKQHLPFSFVDEKTYKTLERKLKSSPTTGMSCLMEFLRLEINKLSLFGVDFYRTLPYEGYYPKNFDYKNHLKKVLNHGSKNMGNKIKSHNLDSEFEYFKNNLLNNDKIIIDKNLRILIDNE